MGASLNVTAIVQARMGSRRLPGKVLASVCGRPLLWHLLYRLRRATTVRQIVVATTTRPEDDPVVRVAAECGVKVYRGSEGDVLDRYYRAACLYGADPVVRITADCPLIDPEIVDRVVAGFLEGSWDLYGTDETFPDGLDVAVVGFRALEAAWREARLPSEREHVLPYIVKRPERFRVGSLSCTPDLGHIRWTVDEEEDLIVVGAIFNALFRDGRVFGMGEMLDFWRAHPELHAVNGHIVRNEGYLRSLEEDLRFLERVG